ncbi:MAG: patatin-like phospholipase family protein [Streptosporangiaceae bacterium]
MPGSPHWHDGREWHDGPQRPAVHRSGRPRVGLVLGAGGVVGAAWMTGALPALQGLMPCPAGDADVIAGTSAGSVLAAALRCHLTPDEMVAQMRGAAVGGLAAASADRVGGGPYPPVPRLRVGSPRLALTAMLAPHRVPPLVGAAAWLPCGRGQHAELHDMVTALHHHAHGHGAGAPPHWVDRPTWITAVDYDTGRRVVFGQLGAPRARLADAVVASCSIPGWFAPAVIGGRRYVDGGVRSGTSLRLLARAGVDQVYVLAPLAGTAPARPLRPQDHLDRRLRRLSAGALRRDVRAMRAAGIAVTVLTPGPEDIAAMGANLMDPRRRAAVLETSLRTSAAAVAALRESGEQAA